MLIEWDNIPKVKLPSEGFGKTERFRRLFLDLKCRGSFRRIGWLLFGKDGSLYFHIKGRSPILQAGYALVKDGKLIKGKAIDLSSIPNEQKIGTHLSLHPSGEVHVKCHGQKRLLASNIGSWLPVQRPFTFVYIFTESVENLAMVENSDTEWTVDDPGKSLRLNIVVCPRYQKAGISCDPFYESTVCLGLSPHYAVLINANVLPPCESHIFFLASPIHLSPPHNEL